MKPAEEQVRAMERVRKFECVGQYTGIVMGTTDYRGLVTRVQNEMKGMLYGVDYADGKVLTLVASADGNWSESMKNV